MQRIQVAGDSLVIVNWFQGSFSIASVVLEPWQGKIRALQGSFIDIHMQHISRTYNCLADDLSKRVLNLDPGCMKVDELSCGQLVSSVSFSVF